MPALDAPARDRLHWLCPVLLVLSFAGLYATTLCPTVYWNDSAELVAAATTLGIPHPPGYPLYTLVGWLFAQLPLPPALALNVMSASFSCCAVGLSYAVSRELGATRVSSVFGAALLGLGATFWRHSNIAEVYTPGVAFLLLALWLALVGLRRTDARAACAAGLISGLGLGVHLSIATAGLTFVGLTLLGHPELRALSRLDPRRVLRLGWRRLLAAGSCALLGACVFLYLPWRAQQGPTMNFGNPSELGSWWWVISGGVYKTWFGSAQSFGWRLWHVLRLLSEHLTASGLMLAVMGLWRLGQRRGRVLAWCWGCGVLGNVAYFFDYLVFDLDVFFLPAAAMLASCAALGLDQACSWLRGAFERPRVLRGVQVLVFLGLGAKAWGAYHDRDMSDATGAFEYGERLSERLPSSAVLVTYTSPPEWRYYTVFRWYFQLVLKRRVDVYVYVFPAADFVHSLIEEGYAVYAFAEVPLLDEFELVAQDDLAPDLVRVTLPPRPASDAPPPSDAGLRTVDAAPQ